MNAEEQNVALAAKMYECRATARRLLGEKFQARMAEYADVIRAVEARDNCNSIVAGATVIESASLQGMDALLLMAAVVEMTEPSNGEVRGASRLAGEASSAEGATSTVVLAGTTGGKDK